MQRTEWRLKGDWIKSCSCAFGCPCDFNARPTRGHCEGILAMDVHSGYFGDVRLDGIKFVATARWPGPLHEGNGTLQPIIDERANGNQREALLEIFSGKHSDEGTLFHIVTVVVSKVLPPQFGRIDFEFDLEARQARIYIPGLLDTDTKPILNPVTGAEHRIQVLMPDGFEHRLAEVASARIESSGDIRFSIPSGHSSLARVEQTPAGVAA